MCCASKTQCGVIGPKRKGLLHWRFLKIGALLDHAYMEIPLLRGPCLGVPRTRIIVYRVDDGAPSVCERTFLLLSGMHPEHLRLFVGLHSTCACTACQDCFTEDLIGCVRLQQVTQCSCIG